MTHVLYLDRYHLGDPLFLNGLARDVLGLGAPCLLVHGAGEAAERALEARGQVVRWDDGVLVAETAEDRTLVARAARNLNRQIAASLNEAGVAAIALEAGGRGLVVQDQAGVRAENVGWLRDLVVQRAVPVVAALTASDEAGVREVNGGAVAGALAAGLADVGTEATVTMLLKQPLRSRENGDSEHAWISLEELAAGALPEPEAVRAALRSGAEVGVVGRSGLRKPPLRGTAVRLAGSEKSP
ncbi:MAG: hypothetical protein AAGI91_05370 [Bacteroidota bacterium]